MSWLEDAERVDLAVYAAVARTPTPALDRVMSRLSSTANYSRLSIAAAGLLAIAGGRSGRRAAGMGLASLAVTSAVVNVAVKPLARRRRPDRLAGDVPLARHVPMPTSRSFPSGHSAAAFAFATGVGNVSPTAAAPLRALAAAVGYSRVHTRVHYPGDVLAGPDGHDPRAAHDIRRQPARLTPSSRLLSSGGGRADRLVRVTRGHHPKRMRSARSHTSGTMNPRVGASWIWPNPTVPRRRRSEIMADVQQAKAGAVATRTRRKPASAAAASKRNGRRPTPKAIPHPTPAERAERGKAARATAPRSEQGEYQPASDRRDPVELLEEQAASRVAELVPIRYGRMLVSPFTFYRGAAYPMAADLAGAPRTGLEVQLCGDAHLSNFGAFAASDRRLVFSINDFDETLPGPFEWDVKRLVASFAVAGRDRGFDTKQRRSVNRAAARAYREGIRAFAEMSNLDLWYSRIDVDEIAALAAQHGSRKERKQFERNRAKAQSKDSLRAFAKLTTVVNGERRIVSDPPLIVPIEDVTGDGMAPGEREEQVHGILRSYRTTLTPDRRRLVERYRYVHSARKVVGVGSVGTRAWIALMLGRDDGDPLFLQLKEAEASVLEPFLGKSKFAKHGQRVVEGQRLTQAASDIMLGWIRITGVDGASRDFYVRQLWDGKGSAIVETMNPKTMRLYAQLCGHALAKAHARSGDAIAIGSYLGGGDSFDRAMAGFAEAYADQNERDYDALRDAAASGHVAAETGL